MSFADPQTITIDASPVTLNRTGSSLDAGTFSKDDGTVKLSVGHTYNKRNRRTIRVDHSKIAADPYATDRNVPLSMSAYLVVDTPKIGYTIAEAKSIVDALVAYLSASTGAAVSQLLGGES